MMTKTEDASTCYDLQYPVINGDNVINTITIRKPTVGELRGIHLTELLQLDVATLEKLLPRITELTPVQLIQLELVDFLGIANEALSFLLSVHDSPRM